MNGLRKEPDLANGFFYITCSCSYSSILPFSFLVGYVEEGPWWPIQKPQQRKKEESKKLRGEKDQIKFIDLRFERWQVVRFRKARGRQDVS